MTNLPQAVANYRLERRLGKGGMSEVWLGRHRILENRLVAIKLLMSQDQEWIERFKLEANITSRLHHDHIVQIFDHGEQGPFHYTVMEYVPGGALRDILREQKRLALEHAAEIFRYAGMALDYAHIHGIIHRDVSPGNILLDQQVGRVLLTDFGIARESGRPGMTTVSNVMGTPGYLSPEHASSATAVTRLSDLYSLGVVFFEMLTGQLPWDHYPGVPGDKGGPFGPPKSLAEAGLSGLPAGLDRVIQTLMAQDPTKRYPTAQAAIDDIQRLLQNHSTGTQIIGRKAAAPETRTRQSLAAPTRREPHPVEVVLGPDLKKAPLQEAAKRAEEMYSPIDIAALLNTWSDQGWLRRQSLGRIASVRHVTNDNIFFYTLRVLYEVREPVQTQEQPDTEANIIPFEKTVERWGVLLPEPKTVEDEKHGTVVIPGSMRVMACTTCSGVGRTKCPRCKGQGRIAAPPPEPKHTEPARPADPTKPGDSAAPAGPPRQSPPQQMAALTRKPDTLIPCPECSGTGGPTCERCTGVGRLVERKTTMWRRTMSSLEAHDDLPEVDERWLQRMCASREIYREQSRKEVRPEWKQVPRLADLIVEAQNKLDENTRIALVEASISFIPVTELVFDLGQRPKTAATRAADGTLVANDMPTYTWRIFGFEKQMQTDWRLLNWDRFWAVFLGIWTLVLMLLLITYLVSAA